MNNADDVIVIWSQPIVSFGARTPEGCKWTNIQEHPPVFLCDRNGTVLTFKSYQEVFDVSSRFQLFEAKNLEELLDWDEAGVYITTLKQCKERNKNFNVEIDVSKSNKIVYTHPAKLSLIKN